MAFERKTFCTFTEISIKKFVPTGSGVYGIYNSTGLLYVGETNSIERRLLEHLNETGTCIKRGNPTDCTWEEVESSKRLARQNALILAYDPPCNKKLG